MQEFEHQIKEVTEVIESAKADKPASHMSKKYVFFSTQEIIEELRKLGWVLTKQSEVKLRKGGKNYQNRLGKQRHLLIFENPNFTIEHEGILEGKINICIRNSHDGGGCLEIFFGFMRIFCANQIFSKSLGEGNVLKLRHSQNYKEEFKNLIKNFIPLIETYQKQIIGLKSKVLNDSQILHFAQEAIKARFGNMSTVQSCLDVQSILNYKRPEDEGTNAWVVFNKVQENLVQGGIEYQTTDKKGKPVTRKTRKLQSINSLIAFNDFLYQLIISL